MFTQRLYFPLLQGSQRRQAIPGSIATLSPTFRDWTADPTFLIIPADSWPRTIGSFTTKLPIEPCSQ